MKKLACARRIILLSELEALGNIPGFRFDKDDNICIIPVCCRSPLVTDANSFTSFFCKKGTKGERYKNILMANGAVESNISFVNYYDPDSYLEKERILNNNFIILPGGLMERGIERLYETKLDSVLAEFSGTIIGFSAGAIMLFDEYLITPNKVYKELKISKGIGILDGSKFMIDVHYNESDIQQRNAIETMCALRNLNVFAITQSGYVIIEEDNVVLSSDVKLFQG